MTSGGRGQGPPRTVCSMCSVCRATSVTWALVWLSCSHLYHMQCWQMKLYVAWLRPSNSQSISFVGLVVQPINKAQINAISTLSNLIAKLSLRTKWHVTWHLHVISARCVARDLHTIAPGPLERTCWRQFAALWGDCKKSRIAPLNAIIIIITTIIIIITIIIITIIIITIIIIIIINIRHRSAQTIAGATTRRWICRSKFLSHPVRVYWYYSILVPALTL